MGACGMEAWGERAAKIGSPRSPPAACPASPPPSPRPPHSWPRSPPSWRSLTRSRSRRRRRRRFRRSRRRPRRYRRFKRISHADKGGASGRAVVCVANAVTSTERGGAMLGRSQPTEVRGRVASASPILWARTQYGIHRQKYHIKVVGGACKLAIAILQCLLLPPRFAYGQDRKFKPPRKHHNEAKRLAIPDTRNTSKTGR